VILAVTDVKASTSFYVDVLGLTCDAEFEDPPYASLSISGTRVSLIESGHPTTDLDDVTPAAVSDPSRPSSMLVLEVSDCEAAFSALTDRGIRTASPLFRPPWGGARFFIQDPDGFFIEIEELA
jgi:catechol 2,3-dioxygenase-like lactoylglutathione lyase family enzyme